VSTGRCHGNQFWD